MTYLVCYDIENDKNRKKFHDKLLAMGLERVQYSVFMGQMPKEILTRIKKYGEQLLSPKEYVRDSILILRLQPSEVENMIILGDKEIDVKMITGTRNTLFF